MKVVVLVHTIPGAIFQGTTIDPDVIEMEEGVDPEDYLHENGYRRPTHNNEVWVKHGPRSTEKTVAFVRNLLSAGEERDLAKIAG